MNSGIWHQKGTGGFGLKVLTFGRKCHVLLSKVFDDSSLSAIKDKPATEKSVSVLSMPFAVVSF